jgi:hypothetical protein
VVVLVGSRSRDDDEGIVFALTGMTRGGGMPVSDWASEDSGSCRVRRRLRAVAVELLEFNIFLLLFS